MALLSWRLRMWARRLPPHTPIKQWSYGAILCLAIALAAFGRFAPAGALLGAAFAVRLVDINVGRRRRGRMPTQRAYFFEGDEDGPARGRR